MDNHLTIPFRREIVRLKRYGNLTPPVLDNVSLDIGSSDVVAIVGKSGVGKSTLLKIIGRSLAPTAGIAVHSDQITRPGAVAYMDQTSTVFPWKRTRQIIALSLARAKSRTNVRKTDVAEALAGFGLQGTGDRYPQELSGGMKQRLALAFAVLREPTLLLLDEPFGSVDEFTREGLYLLLQAALVRAPTAVVMVTHSISECLTLADRIIVLGGNPSATVAGIFTVDRPKPRSATALLEPDLVALNKEIRRKIGEL